MNGLKFRDRPVDEVIHEVENCGSRMISINDADFFDMLDRLKEVMRALRGRGINWQASVTSKLAQDDRMLELAAASSCTMLSIGFESISRAASCLGRKEREVGQREDRRDGLSRYPMPGSLSAATASTRAAATAAIFRKACACAESGRPTVIGTPASPPSRVSISSGICPRSGTPNSSATRWPVALAEEYCSVVPCPAR
jgi:hypothetical protein